MQKYLKVKKGYSIDNAIIINATNSIEGVVTEHEHLDRICGSKDTDVKSLEQNLLMENQKIYDQFVIKMNDGTEKILYFEITSFFGKI
jgi:hypothetical protein